MGLLEMLKAKEAEAAPAVKGFAKKYDKAVRDGDKRMMFAGTLDDEVYKAATKKDPSVKQNKVFVGPHGGEARLATGEMTPEEVGRHIENLLNSGETKVLPNFPSNNYRNNTKNMLYLNDGKDIVAPFMAGKSGDVVLRTAFEPQKDRMKFIEGYLGRPLSPMSGLRDNPASAQPPGLSAVRQPSIDGLLGRPKAPISGLRSDPASAQPQGLSVVSEPSTESTIPQIEGSYKKNLPVMAGTMTGLSAEQGLETPFLDPVDLILAPLGVAGWGQKAAAMAAEPFVSYGMDKALEYISKLWGEE